MHRHRATPLVTSPVASQPAALPTPGERPRCDGWTRRDFLHAGWLAPFGFGLADLFRVKAETQSALATSKAVNQEPSASKASGIQARANSCILIWLDGGPSHLDTFDPKPEAPSEIRGPFRSIPTRLPGVHVCEHLPRIAGIMDRLALIRSLTHELGNHDTGTRFLLTGHRPAPGLEYPSLGSTVARSAGFGRPVPPYVAIPGDSVGGNSNAARSGYLPGAYNAFQLGPDSARVPGLHWPAGLNLERSLRRRDLLRQVDTLSRQVEEGPITRDRDAFFEQAYRLITSPEAKNALDLSREPASSRERYGSSRVGQGCLLARRMVEAGSRFVTVVDSGWDTHQQIARELPDSRFPGSGKLPSLDRAFSSLISDLHDRGLLDTTLVVLLGEFGRTPKFNATGGRDHWPRAGFACLAGGGVAGGRVIGATNSFGESPIDRPVSPPDLVHTILTLLGIDPASELQGPAGRPLKVLNEGAMIRELIG